MDAPQLAQFDEAAETLDWSTALTKDALDAVPAKVVSTVNSAPDRECIHEGMIQSRPMERPGTAASRTGYL
jgi:hypothetical protein